MNEMKQKQYNEYDKCRVFVNSVCQRLGYIDACQC